MFSHFGVLRRFAAYLLAQLMYPFFAAFSGFSLAQAFTRCLTHTLQSLFHHFPLKLKVSVDNGKMVWHVLQRRFPSAASARCSLYRAVFGPTVKAHAAFLEDE
jgi:hypothetical protein